jgi:hypothetical protein
VTHGFLHLHCVATFREPRGHTTMAKVVLVKVRRQFGTRGSRLKRPPEHADALAGCGTAARREVMEYPRRLLACVGSKPEASEVISHGLPKLPGHRHPIVGRQFRPLHCRPLQKRPIPDVETEQGEDSQILTHLGIALIL